MNLRLVIAEKPSVAKTYATVLGAKTKKNGYYEGNGYIVSWCVGHLLGLANPSTYNEKYDKWRKEDLPIVPSAWKYVATPSTKSQLKVLVELMKRSDVSTIISGTDAGREGELIFRLVYEHAFGENSKNKKPVQRLWISSMEESAIRNGFNNLRPSAEYDSLYHAAKCRQQADWLVGMNYSRLFSIIYNANLRVGRVQTPTLAMVVERSERISNFTKEPFYVVTLNIHDNNQNIITEGEKLTDKAIANEIVSKCNGQTATIKSIKQQEKTIAPPKLYDLTTLQREANKLFGLTASKTLEIAQTLYEKKIITYPRTDSKYITEDMAHSIEGLLAASMYVLFPKQNFVSNISLIVNNSKVTDHHAILPTMQVKVLNLAMLSEDERNILTLICAKLICAVNEKHSYAETVVTVECNGELFTTKGKSIVHNGWKQVEEDLHKTLGKAKKNITSDSDDTLSANLTQGQQFTATTSLREGFTSPPKHYTEDTLLSAMETAGVGGVQEDIERKGLGTPATRASIIENLVRNELLKRDKKNLLPTEKGINLIKVLPDKVKSPLLTAEWENNLKRMERDEVTPNDFMESINNSIDEIVQTYGAAPIPENNRNLFGSERSSGNSGEVIGKCPRCNSNVYESPKAFSCEHTKTKICGFSIWKDNKLFTLQGKNITKTIVKSLLTTGKAYVEGFKSKKTGKTYNATVVLDDNKDGYTNFKLEFSK